MGVMGRDGVSLFVEPPLLTLVLTYYRFRRQLIGLPRAVPALGWRSCIRDGVNRSVVVLAGVDDEDTEQYLKDEDTEQHLKDEDTEQHLKDEDTEQHLKDEDTEQHLKDEDTEQYLKDEDTEQHLKDEDTEQHLKDEDTEQHLKDEDTEQHLKDEDTEQHLKDEDTEQHLKDEDTEQHLKDEDTEQHLKDEDTEQHLKDEDTEQHLKDEDTEQHLKDEDTEQHLKDEDTFHHTTNGLVDVQQIMTNSKQRLVQVVGHPQIQPIVKSVGFRGCLLRVNNKPPDLYGACRPEVQPSPCCCLHASTAFSFDGGVLESILHRVLFRGWVPWYASNPSLPT
ncbi:hypothetical protein ACOMHN_060413 [Nucella lapillus]